MTKVYIEHDDHHNSPILRTYESEEAALDDLTHYHPEDREFARRDLFSDEGGGEWNDSGDRYTVITFGVAEGRAQYWQNVADCIRAGEDAPP